MHSITVLVRLGAFLGALLPLTALADADSARNKGAAWLIKQQRGDGSWASSNGELSIQATSAALLAFKNSGLAKAPTFGTAASWLANADADSIDSIARKAEGLQAAGMPATAQAAADRMYELRTLSSSATWGGYGGSVVDYLDTALGLTALRLADAGYAAKANGPISSALCELGAGRVNVAAGKQAWPATKATTNQSAAQGRPSVVATALVLGELPRLQTATSIASVTCGPAGSQVTYPLATLQAEARAWLLDQQNPDSGFGEQRSDGSKGASSVLVTSLVYRAMNRQAAPPQPQTANAHNWLLNQQDTATGSWHSDPLVTATVLASLTAAAGAQLADTDGDGITNVVEAQLGSNASVADARGQLGAPTLASPGFTATSFEANATVGQVFSYALGAGSAFSISSGSLPPGVGLNAATGQVSGTPSRAGAYGFEFSAIQLGTTQLVIGRIDVAAGEDVTTGDTDAPLPLWALVLLGSALLGVSRYRRPHSS